ncbi:MAG: DNA double-strand break repair nuclease NurA [Candidatus Caldarchaeum sp.]
MMTKMTNQYVHQLTPTQELQDLLKTFSSVAEATVKHLHGSERLPLQADDDRPDLHIQLLTADSFQTIPITQSNHSVPVVACDMSTVKVAETTRGSVWAVRGSIVVRHGSRLTASVVGPFMYNISSYTAARIVDALLASLAVRRKSRFLDVSTAPKIVSNLFEKLIQLYAGTLARDGLLLVDGALTAGPLDSPPAVVERIVETTVGSSYGVIAFSKSTTLMLYGQKITSYADGTPPPYVIKLPMLKDLVVRNGSVYVARLSSARTPFRVDVVSRTSDEQVFSLLLSSDNIVNGYPESLILAHHLAKLNRLDVLGISTRLEGLMSIKTSKNDVRSMLFTPIDG